MPRVGSKASEPPSGNALVASAVRLPGNTSRVYRNGQGWQAEAWRYYDLIGELRYAANWVGNVLSRATLHGGRKTPLGLLERDDLGAAGQALEALFGGKDGQEQMLKLLGIHLFIAGECYLVGRAPRADRNETGKDDIWEIASVEELRSDGKTWRIQYDDGLPDVVLTDDEVVVRIWNQHPRKRVMADSPVRAQLQNLAELLTLSRTVSAQARSRLAGNGLLALPSEFTFTPPPDNPTATGVQVFTEVLGGAMAAPIEDPMDPAAIVPVIISAPGDQIGNIRHITFWSEFDDKLPDLRNEAIRRLALGLDIPAEIMLGTADMNHWSAWQVDESAIKASIEPMLASISNSLAYGYVQAITGDPEDFVGFDTSNVRLRPNRSKEALELYDRGELSGTATRRETGFDDTDMPDEQERRLFLLRRMASGSASPEQVAMAMAMLGVEGIMGVGDHTNEERPAPSLEEHPVQDIPERAAASLMDKSEVLVFRALERAGNRLRATKHQRPPCSADATYLFVNTDVGELDYMLEDAWTIIPKLFPELPEFERSVVTKALDAYCRHLLATQKVYDRNELARYLTSTPIRTLQ